MSNFLQICGHLSGANGQYCLLFAFMSAQAQAQVPARVRALPKAKACTHAHVKYLHLHVCPYRAVPRGTIGAFGPDTKVYRATFSETKFDLFYRFGFFSHD